MFGESWEADGPDEGDCVDGYTITWAREFRYDAARARYLNRELDPEALEEGDLVALSEVWTDYDGDSSYGDFELAGDPLMPSDLRSYEPGVALKDPWDESSGIASSGIESSGIEYYHADLIGTTRAMTDYTGASASTVCYTAFGERLDSDDHLRYGYAGSWGYQAHDVPNGDPVPYLHVGWRYYDPSTGRFLQRDPIGIAGGIHAYVYVGSMPARLIDPSGLDWQESFVEFIEWIYSPITKNEDKITATVESCVKKYYVRPHYWLYDRVSHPIDTAKGVFEVILPLGFPYWPSIVVPDSNFRPGFEV